MRGGSGILMAWLFAVGCGGAPGQDAGRSSAAATEGARALLASVPDALAARGPAAWLDFFEDSPSFFMASDGAIAFPDLPAARRFLADFAPQVAGMSLAWHEPRFEALGGGVVVVTTAYDERIRLADGTESSFGGHMSGVVRLGVDGWRFQHLHWSSPAATDEEADTGGGG